MRKCLEKKEKIRFNFCLLKNWETKMTNLVSDLFILLSVYPMWGKDVVGQDSHINMTELLVGKLELKPVEENNLDIAQASLRIYSMTPYKEDHTCSKSICKFLFRYFFSHTILSETFVCKNNWLSVSSKHPKHGRIQELAERVHRGHPFFCEILYYFERIFGKINSIYTWASVAAALL